MLSPIQARSCCAVLDFAAQSLRIAPHEGWPWLFYANGTQTFGNMREAAIRPPA